ncbi:factor for double strand breaks DNA repair and genetic recombination [Acetoanaerobium sticklandii]|uniref:DNA repair protein RecN n=1 Tax=Acetoanaerobium sticklandii (strain ATCC 12662 / DSM 519 / JCM 1433 / CCUG 9281 / NCIMB 10654 / HF) TaxID=499177 RepID=E3PRF6_ACESD|nr:DNA repair protein RecN [Acetoanaerobium sticklandii]CBH21460.1 factor for double strand breaks DNA repair and genetic recombination [Acetoanaerobium sticklandii]
MLKELCIKDFALIDYSKINFFEGFNIFTGETGAGKSIVIDALLFALGKRADKSFIRKNKSKTTIEAIFYLESNNKDAIKSLLIEEGIDLDEDMIILRREIYEDGKSTCRLNGKLVTRSFLSLITSLMITIHSQNEFSEILTKESQLNILDDFISLKSDDVYNSYKKIFLSYRLKQEELSQILTTYDNAFMLRELDIIKYQIKEIEEAKLNKGEFEGLESKINLLEHSEEISLLINNIYNDSYSNSDNILKKIDLFKNSLSKFSKSDELINNWYEGFNEVYYKLEDITLTIRDNLDKFSYDYGKLADLKQRYSDINKILLKYGKDIDSVFDYLGEMYSRKNYLENIDSNIIDLKKEISSLEIELEKYSKKISQKRLIGISELKSAIVDELISLDMINSKFDIKLENTTEFGINGRDSISFLISFNKGEDLKPFNKIASGGEISRFMLALKKVSATFDNISTIVFDEIDTGISGKAAKVVGEKLKEISKHRQIICITHLPQIAAKGDYHFAVQKLESGDNTHSFITQLSKDERISEIAKMISGDDTSTTSYKYAKEMIELN